MALSFVMAVTHFDTSSIAVVRRRLKVCEFLRRNLPLRESVSPTESVTSSGYSSLDTIISSSTSIDSRRQSPSDLLPASQLVPQTESEAGSEEDSQANSQIEVILESLLETISGVVPRTKTLKACSKDFPKDYREYSAKVSEKDVLQESSPLRLMYGNRDILNLGANVRKPSWPKIPEHNVEEGRKRIDTTYYRLEADDLIALNEAYPVEKCHNCSFRYPAELLFDQHDSTDYSTDKNVKKPTKFCCGRKMATDMHDMRVICRRNRR